MAVPSFFHRRPAWLKGGVAVTTRWLESTLEVARWENMRKAGKRWGKWGAALGALIGVVLFAPASWLAHGVVDLTDPRLAAALAERGHRPLDDRDVNQCPYAGHAQGAIWPGAAPG